MRHFRFIDQHLFRQHFSDRQYFADLVMRKAYFFYICDSTRAFIVLFIAWSKINTEEAFELVEDWFFWVIWIPIKN